MGIFSFSEIVLLNSFSSQESFDDTSLAKQKEIQETDPTYEEKMVCNIWHCVHSVHMHLFKIDLSFLFACLKYLKQIYKDLSRY